MTEPRPIDCAHCDGPIPPRPDPRGRPARYCSGACRAAASRARASQTHERAGYVRGYTAAQAHAREESAARIEPHRQPAAELTRQQRRAAERESVKRRV